MKRPAKVTKETRLNQYARKLLGKEKKEQIEEAEDFQKVSENLSGKHGAKKKIRTSLNRKLRRDKTSLPNGAHYRKSGGWEE